MSLVGVNLLLGKFVQKILMKLKNLIQSTFAGNVKITMGL